MPVYITNIIVGIGFLLMFIYFYVYKLIIPLFMGKIPLAVGVLRLITVLAVLILFAVGLGVFQDVANAVLYGEKLVIRSMSDYARMVMYDDVNYAIQFIRKALAGYM